MYKEGRRRRAYSGASRDINDGGVRALIKSTTSVTPDIVALNIGDRGVAVHWSPFTDGFHLSVDLTVHDDVRETIVGHSLRGCCENDGESR